MSKIFDALKKAKNDQVEKLFGQTSKENVVRVPKYFNTPPHPTNNEETSTDSARTENLSLQENVRLDEERDWRLWVEENSKAATPKPGLVPPASAEDNTPATGGARIKSVASVNAP